MLGTVSPVDHTVPGEFCRLCKMYLSTSKKNILSDARQGQEVFLESLRLAHQAIRKPRRDLLACWLEKQ